MKIRIIRHSQRYDYSYPHKWLFYLGHYWADPMLTSDGRDKAAIKANMLKKNGFSAGYVYTSPYIRTIETATEMKSVFHRCQMIIEPLFAEYQPFYKHRISLYPDGVPTSFQGIETEFSYPETKEAHRRRIEFILTKIVEKHSDTDEIIIVTHAEVIRTVCEYLNTKFPYLLLDASYLPYLAELSLEYDKNSGNYVENSIRLSCEDMCKKDWSILSFQS